MHESCEVTPPLRTSASAARENTNANDFGAAMTVSTVPSWLEHLMTRTGQSIKARYVMVGDRPFHVSASNGGHLVAEVEQYRQNGVQKLVHNPYRTQDQTYQDAVLAYEADILRQPSTVIITARGTPRIAEAQTQPVSRQPRRTRTQSGRHNFPQKNK